MRQTHGYRNGIARSRTGLRENEKERVRSAVAETKQAVLDRYATMAGEHARLLRLALNEAEGLAWQTEFPHLFFPALAEEKARAAVAWHQRQTALRRVGEQAFAE